MKKTNIFVMLNLGAAIACLGFQASSLGVTMLQAFMELPWGSFLTGLSLIANGNASVGSKDLLTAWFAITGAGIAIQAAYLFNTQRAALSDSVKQPADAEPQLASDHSNSPGLHSMSEQVSDPALRDELLRLEAALSKLAASGKN